MENTEQLTTDPDALPQADDRSPTGVEPEPEAPKVETPAPEPEKKPNGIIQDLQRERQRRREAEEKFAKAADRFEKLTGLIQQPAPPPPPDREKDPLEWISHTVQQAVKPLAEKVAKIETTSAEQAQVAQQRALQQHVASLESQFAAKTPDYNNAAQHVLAVYTNQFRALGLGDDQVADRIAEYQSWIVNQSLQNGRNPAEALYEIAKTIGYQAPQAPQPQQQPMTQQQPKPPTSLSTVPGVSPSPSGISVDKLLNLPDDEFDKAVQGKNWEKLRKLLES